MGAKDGNDNSQIKGVGQGPMGSQKKGKGSGTGPFAEKIRAKAKARRAARESNPRPAAQNMQADRGVSRLREKAAMNKAPGTTPQKPTTLAMIKRPQKMRMF